MLSEDDLTKLCEDAVTAMNEERWAEAKEMFEKVLLQEPGSLDMRQNYAFCIFRMGEYADALEQLTLVLQGDPHNLSLIDNFATVFAQMGVSLKDGLEEIYQKVPSSTAVMLNLENMAMEEEDTQTANQWLQRLLVVLPDMPLIYYYRALGYQLIGDSKAALEAIDQMVAAYPDDPIAYYYRASFLNSMNELPKALDDLEMVCQLSPESAYGYQLGADWLFQAQNFDQAREWYQKSLERDANNLDALSGIGLCYENVKDYDKALDIYDQLVEKTPERPEGYYYRARVNEANGDTELAEDDYLKSIEYYPVDNPSYLSLGQMYLNLQRYPDAQVVFQFMTRLNKQDPVAFNGLGLSYEGQNDYSRAIRAYNKVIKLAPESTTGYLNLGRMYHNQERYRKAVKAYNMALRKNPEEWVARALRGKAYQAMGNYELAEKDLAACASYYDKDTQSYLDLAFLYYLWAERDPEKLSDALETCQKILAWEQNDPVIYEALATINEDLGENKQAIKMYNRLLVLDANSYAGYVGRGRVYVQLAEYTRALTDLNKALELSPDDSIALINRGLLWQAVDAQERALHDFQAALKQNPNNTLLRKTLADTLFALEGYDLAVDQYDQVLAKEPENLEALIGKADGLRLWAKAAHDLPLYLQAVEAADAVIEASLKKISKQEAAPTSEPTAPDQGIDYLAEAPEMIQALAIKAYCLNALGQTADGMALYDRALAMYPDYDWAITEKATALYRHGDFQEALESFKLLKKKSKVYRAAAVVGEACCLRKAGKERQAVKLLDSMIKEPGTGEDYKTRCFAFHDIGENTLAFEDGKKAVELNPNLSVMYNQVAWILVDNLKTDLEYATKMAERGIEKSQAEAKEAEALDQNDPTNVAKVASSRIELGLVLDTLGWIWYHRGDLQKALQYLKQGIEMQPEDQEKRLHLRVVEEAVRQPAETTPA